jgi:hypothetical protein
MTREQQTMKTSIYKLAGQDVPETLKGRAIELAEGETLAEVVSLCNDEGAAQRALQASIDIWKQGRARAFASSDECPTDADEAVVWIQEQVNNLVYGTTVRSAPGTGAAAAKKTVSAISEAAKNDPELAAKLAALGVTL